jgi:RNA polymerase sigma factor (sigma-70 family)
MKESNELLREYVDRGTESSFRELVDRYMDLVYSSARRRMGGAESLAEDVAQEVFLDLSRKAGSLPENVFLGGWLHRHTCFVAGTHMRKMARRQVRETNAALMDDRESVEGQESEWRDISEILDELIDRLPEKDRISIVLRYIEQKGLREIGARLGVSDDAAQKRVGRALERLRGDAMERGLTISTAALAAWLSAHCLEAAPAALSEQTVEAVIRGGGGTGAAALGGLLTPALIKALGVATIVALLGWGLVATSSSRRVDAVAPAPVVNSVAGKPAKTASNTAPGREMASPAAAPAKSTDPLEIRVFASDTGEPIPNVEFQIQTTHSEGLEKSVHHADRAGICRVKLKRDALRTLKITAIRPGFEDAGLTWQPSIGTVIPVSYDLRLERAVTIGGRVENWRGAPIAGLKVSLGFDEGPNDKGKVRTLGLRSIDVATDRDGKWSVERVGEIGVRRVGLMIKSEDYPHLLTSLLAGQQEAEKQLRGQVYVTRLEREAGVSGRVVDEHGEPLEGVAIVVGDQNTSARRDTTTDAAGAFSVKGCHAKKLPVFARLQGRAPATIEVDASNGEATADLTLKPGSRVRVRITDQEGAPVSKASISPGGEHARSDEDGRCEFYGASGETTTLSIRKRGFMNHLEEIIVADGLEANVTLIPELVLVGTVRDAETGALIPNFRIIAGTPLRDVFGKHDRMPFWSAFSWHWHVSKDGHFRFALNDTVIPKERDKGFIFKFEAEGYETRESTTVAPDGGLTRMDVTLRRQGNTGIQIMLPNGRPAVAAEVGLIAPGARLSLAPGGFDRGVQQGRLLRSGKNGRVQLPLDESVQRVVFIHPKGFAELSGEEAGKRDEVSLLAWGRIEGVYRRDGIPAANRELSLTIVNALRGALRMDHNLSRCRTDAQGRFQFEDVPPTICRVSEMTPMESPPGSTGTMSKYEPGLEVRVLAGQTTEVDVDLRRTGFAETLKLPGGLDANPDWMEVISITPLSTAELAPGQVRAGGGYKTRLLRDENSILRAEIVAGGAFQINARYVSRDDAGRSKIEGQGETTVFVPEELSGLVNYGVVQMRPPDSR